MITENRHIISRSKMQLYNSLPALVFAISTATTMMRHLVLAEYPQNVAPQVPNVIDALYNFGNPPLATDYMYLMKNAVPGVTFPTHGYIPYTSFGCEQVPHPGYFADYETDCQVFRRCDHRGDMTSYLCPNGTLFNQLTLVCDWWFNVDCARAREFYSYANPRINNRYVQLHDNKLDGYGGGGGVAAIPAIPAGGGYGPPPIAGPIIPAIPVIPVSAGYGGGPKLPIGGGYGPPPPGPYDAYGSSISVAVGSPSGASGGAGGSGGGGTAAYGQQQSALGTYGSAANRVQYRRSTAQKKDGAGAGQQASSSAASELTPKVTPNASINVAGGGGSDQMSSASEHNSSIVGGKSDLIAASPPQAQQQRQAGGGGSTTTVNVKV